jgi:hypothetical protein
MIDKNRIGIVIIATNAYFVLGIRFIKKFMHYYNGNSNIKFYFFSNEDPTNYLLDDIDITFIETNHLDWRIATNSKFKNIINIQNQLSNEVDYVYYFDADTDIIDKFNEDWFIGDLVGGEHFGNKTFLSNGKQFDRNPISNAYVPENSELLYTYYYGAFFGGKTLNTINFCKILSKYQIEDQLKGYEPPVNDESYINAYFHYNPPTRTIFSINFEFVISDKGGLDDMRNPDLDVSDIKKQILKNKFKIFELKSGNLEIFE